MTLASAAYLHVANEMGLPQELADAVIPATISFQEEMRPRDALERLALSQLLLTHSRASWLSQLATAQKDPQALGIISEACERASGSFVRLMRAFREHREPKNPSTSVSIAHANVAENQVVQNLLKQEAREGGKDDERTRKLQDTAAFTPALPANAGRTALPAANHSPNATVEKKHRAENRGRKGANSAERYKSRAAVSGHDRAAEAYDKDNL